MSPRIKTHRDFEVWQRSMDLVTEIYRVTERFPVSERFGLTTQLRRAAVSIPVNISEGAARTGPREFAHFISIARGSAAEVETLIEITELLAFARGDELASSRSLIDGVSRMLTVLRRKL